MRIFSLISQISTGGGQGVNIGQNIGQNRFNVVCERPLVAKFLHKLRQPEKKEPFPEQISLSLLHRGKIFLKLELNYFTSKTQRTQRKLQIVTPLYRVIELHIGKMGPFLFITSLVHSLGPRRSKYDISFSYLHSLFYMVVQDQDPYIALGPEPGKPKMGNTFRQIP